MGTKAAGIHFFAQGESLLPQLEREFSKAPGPGERDRAMMALLHAMTEQHIVETAADEAERTEKMALLDAITANGLREAEAERALLVLRPAGLSLYWYDQIRTDNLVWETKRYAGTLGVPALGLALYDDDDVILCASDGTAVQHGSYWFSEDVVEPADPTALCAVLGLEDRVSFVAEALQRQDAEEMIQSLERAFFVDLFLDAADCQKAGWEQIAAWPGADVFRAC